MSLNKAGEYWWSAVLEGEEPIDIDQINKERSMATVGEEEHAVLDRLTFDYHQKLQGKPQSHELVRGRLRLEGRPGGGGWTGRCEDGSEGEGEGGAGPCCRQSVPCVLAPTALAGPLGPVPTAHGSHLVRAWVAPRTGRESSPLTVLAEAWGCVARLG